MPPKKGGEIQFQIDADDEATWRKLLRREGLVVVDAYASWAGPCVAMVPILKRVKVEVNDERLWYGCAVTDKIDELAKFRDQSEPCWLFFASGKPLRVVRGSNGPILIAAIKEEFAHEVECISGTARRNYINIEDEETRKRKIEEEAVKLAPFVVEMDEPPPGAADATRMSLRGPQKKEEPLRRESSMSLMAALDFYTVAIIQPYLIENKKAKDIVDGLGQDFNIMNQIEKELSEEEIRKLYKIPLMKKDKILEAPSTASTVAGKDEPPKAATAEKKKKAPEWEPVNVPEGLLGTHLLVLLEHEDIKALADSGMKPMGTILETADDWLRLRVGPIKYDKAVEIAPQTLIGTYGKSNDIVGVWCPRTYEDRRYAILTYFPELIEKIVEKEPLQGTTYAVIIYPIGAREQWLSNEPIKEHMSDIQAKGNMRISKAIADEMVKSRELKGAELMMVGANLTANELWVVSYNAKNSKLKSALTAIQPIFHQSDNEEWGRRETAKLFPKLGISPEELTDPKQIVSKFLSRTKPRVLSKTSLMKSDMPVIPVDLPSIPALPFPTGGDGEEEMSETASNAGNEGEAKPEGEGGAPPAEGGEEGAEKKEEGDAEKKSEGDAEKKEEAKE